jgi:hypothetical protein
MFSHLKYFFILVLFLPLIGCDLEVQKPFEFVPETKNIATYEDKTVWEWLQTQKSPTSLTAVDQYKFDFLIDAIEYTGLVDEFNRKSDRRTFLLLNNNAFDDANKILQTLTGKVTGPVRAADKTRLTNLLKYHIIDKEYITQIDPLKVYGSDYFFQTLNEGDNGKILLRRDERYTVSVNPATVFPLTATRRGTTVRTHNLRYANGIAHVLNDYTRNVAF